jgi:hypothetical protein
MSVRKVLVEALSLIDRGFSGTARKELGKALIGLQALESELAEARETLQFVERWANHHGVKPCVTPAEALGVIQHHPAIVEITDSYADGKRPTTRNPYAELAEAKARAVIPDGWVAVPVEPITGENYENGLWSRRNWTAALEDMLSARPDPKESRDEEIN